MFDKRAASHIEHATISLIGSCRQTAAQYCTVVAVARMLQITNVILKLLNYTDDLQDIPDPLR